MFTKTKIHVSSEEDNRYLQIEMEGEYGILYEVFSKGDVFNCTTLSYLWETEHGIEYDSELNHDQISFLESIYKSSSKI